MTFSTDIRPKAALHTNRATAPAVGTVQRIRSLHGLWMQRRQLAAMNAAQLEDIGLTEAEADQEALRPFWDVPKHWRQ